MNSPEAEKIKEEVLTKHAEERQIEQAKLVDAPPDVRRRMTTRGNEKISRAKKWWIGFAYTSIHVVLITLDLIMVLYWKIQSISSMTWDACEDHPTLIAAGILMTVGICYIVRHWWWMCMFSGIMGGHLFVHT